MSFKPSREVRDEFLSFFRDKGHEIVPSAPIVPKDDPTLLFINAGMNPFKDVFLGTGSRPYTRVADTQKVLRVSGKHNDLEEVGHDTYHHTFFEMLGNWSFGDYFKKDAIAWAWELLVDRWGLDPSRLYATVHQGDELLGLEPDEEAVSFWKSETSIPNEHVLYGSSDDNFWMMGDTGPCGPCSEIHVDLRSDDDRAKTPGRDLVNQEHPHVIEVWNLVFIQYNAQSDGSLKPLAAKHVDTGMGFERICAVLQGVSSTYDTDVFAGLFERLRDLRGNDAPSYADASEKEQIAMRVVADHIRAIAFATADGASPSNVGRGYVIRRILRRAVRYGYQSLGFREPFLWKLIEPLAESMGDAFPELVERRSILERTISAEEEGFLRTLSDGIDLYQPLLRVFSDYSEDTFTLEAHSKRDRREEGQDDELRTVQFADSAFRSESLEAVIQALSEAAVRRVVPGEIAFLLHDTYGFPFDLTALMAREHGLSVDESRFEELMQEQRDRARAAGSFAVDHSDVTNWQTVSEGEHSRFVGHDTLEANSVAVRRVRSVTTDNGERHELVLSETPFYAESGGQIGDRGVLRVNGSEINVLDTKKSDDGSIVHVVDRLPSELSATFTAQVDPARRRETRKHHTATHLLHAALREILGDHVQQKGSHVAPERLRFDFAHFERVTEEQQRAIERRVNALIQANIPANIEMEVPLQEAKSRGAMALFGEKYGEHVRVVTFDAGVSVELCGGTHVTATGEIGYFRIVSEGSVASGIRRIEAVAGLAALQAVEEDRASLDRIRSHFRTLQQPVEEAVEEVLHERKSLEKELADLKQQIAASRLTSLLETPAEVAGIRLVTGDIGRADMNTLRDVATDFRARLGSNGIAILGAVDPEGEKVYLAASVSDDLTSRVQAGKLVGEIAKRVGGGGGGRPNLATAGGKNPENLPDALAAVPEILASFLG
jgi:alanyl-tRNA synthetase